MFSARQLYESFIQCVRVIDHFSLRTTIVKIAQIQLSLSVAGAACHAMA